VDVKALPDNKYLIRLQNMSIPLPIDVLTDAGTKRIIADEKGYTITSKKTPVIDDDMYYLKKITIE
jgi:hypothetical protein